MSQSSRLPGSLSYKERTYPFSRLLGRGGSGSVGLYGSASLGFLVLKMSYCGHPDAEALATAEASNALSIAQSGPCSPKTTRGPTTGAELLRPPLATSFRQGCAYAIYEYVPDNLSEWLRRKKRRTPDEVTSLFIQLLGILLCLKSKGFYYNDVKPSNLLVSDTGAGLRIEIGDLGGVDRIGDANITITKARVPPSIVADLGWDRIDVLASFLLGELTLQLLLRAPTAGERHPMDKFLACLQAQSAEACTERLCSELRENLADGLSLEDPAVHDLAAIALNLLGYKGLYVPFDRVPELPSTLFTPAR